MNEPAPPQPAQQAGATPPNAAAARPRTSPLAIWAISLATLGVCLFPLAFIGALLGVIALVKTSKDPNAGGKVLAIVSIAMVPVSLFIGGMVAALAIPAFVGYVRRAKTTEATQTLNAVFVAVDAKYRETGGIVQVPLTPAEVPCGEPRAWSAEELARFRDLGVEPIPNPSHFSYEVVPAPPQLTDTDAVLRAHGDLDCDGTQSLFELAIARDDAGGLFHAEGFYIEREIE